RRARSARAPASGSTSAGGSRARGPSVPTARSTSRPRAPSTRSSTPATASTSPRPRSRSASRTSSMPRSRSCAATRCRRATPGCGSTSRSNRRTRHAVTLHLLAMRYLVLLILPLLLVACDSNDPAPEPGASAVLVANQGNFSDGDGSVTAYDPETGTATERIGGLASIVQSVELSGDRLFVTANSGGRVEVRSARSGERLGLVEVESPRYVASAGPNKAYVTSLLYDRPSEVVVFDPSTQEVAGTVEVGGF